VKTSALLVAAPITLTGSAPDRHNRSADHPDNNHQSTNRKDGAWQGLHLASAGEAATRRNGHQRFWSWQGSKQIKVLSQREESIVNSPIKTSILILLLIFTSALSATYAIALDKRHPEHFLPEERRIISEYYRRANTTKKGLPPGLAKRGGKLPPGLQKQLERNGQLPPGLQKRLEPLPSALDSRLPSIPEYWERVIVERDVILLDRRTNRILDIIENVIGLATGQ
jgi:hypothetical protein